jgi:hypothetical protein
MSLRLEPCSYEAAQYAVLRWHYSRSMPAGKMFRLGCWYEDTFWGVIIFSRSSNYRIGRPYGLEQTGVAELTRVALKRGHPVPVSRAVAIALRLLKKHNPGLRLVVSYADAQQGHVGKIYQAGNWAYVGQAGRATSIELLGRRWHRRSVKSRFGTSSIGWPRAHSDSTARAVGNPVKSKYLMPLDKVMRRQIAALLKPYPKRLPDRGTPDQQEQAV